MPRDPRTANKTAKKPYTSPSFVVLDASSAKARLKASGDPTDALTLKMLSSIGSQLKSQKPKSQS